MGQYWYAVNLDKREFINPHKLGDGLKLWEQLANGWTAKGVLILCAAMPHPRGGGDLKPNDIIGAWAGDRVAWIGDYAEDSDLAIVHPDDIRVSQIYEACANGDWTDVSDEVCEVLASELGVKFEGTGWRSVVEAA